MLNANGFVILGGGAVVSEFYLPAFAQLGWLGHVKVADPSPQVVARINSSFPEVTVATCDFRDALRQGRDLDRAAIVALPNALHEAAVNDALDLGMDVLCEKPLALTADACRRLADQAERVDRLLAVGMTRRFLPSVQAARQVIANGWLGDLQSIDVVDGHAFAWSSESGGYFRRENGGVLANVGVHALDLVAYLCGPLIPVDYEDDWRGGAEANSRYTLQTESGIRVTIRLSYTHSLGNGVKLVGSAGELCFDHLSPHVRYRARGGLSADVSIDQPYRFGSWPAGLVSTFAEQLCDFRDASQRRGSPRATAREAVATARLIDWAYDRHAAEGSRSRIETVSTAPRLESGRVVVTGGTGFVGGYVIEALAATGHKDIVVPVRSYRTGANAGRFPVQFERVDLLDAPSLQSLFRNVRYVLHLAYGRDGENSQRITVDGTRNVVEAAITAGVEAVVVLSTAAVFGDPGGAIAIDETQRLASHGNEYERTKGEAEQWALSRATSEVKTRIVVLNPACVYGPRGNTFTALPARLLQENAFCWIENGCGIANYVHASNLAVAILLAAAHPGSHGQRFIVSDGSTTWREFYSELFGDRVSSIASYTRAELLALARSAEPSLRDLGRAVVGDPEVRRILRENARLRRLKSEVARLFPRSYGHLRAGQRRPLRPESAARLAAPVPPVYLSELFGPTSTRLSATKAREVLGWAPSLSLSAGQADARRWLADVGLLDPIDSPTRIT